MTDHLQTRIDLMKNGIKQREIARKAGVTDAFISMILSGKRTCPEHVRRTIRSLIRQRRQKIAA